MSILNILKKIKLPKFEDDFIQDKAEKAIEEAPVSYCGKVVYDPRQDPTIKAAREHLHEWTEEQEKDRHNTPGDPHYIPSASEEW
jgi:hypothetical protein